jgi:hypothetical protein
MPSHLLPTLLQALVGTWNVNEMKPSRPGLQMWLTERAKSAQLVMIGLQVCCCCCDLKLSGSVLSMVFVFKHLCDVRTSADCLMQFLMYCS